MKTKHGVYIFDVLPTIERWCPSNETEGKDFFRNHLGALREQFLLYFQDVSYP